MKSNSLNPFERPHRSRMRSLGVGPMPKLSVRAIEVVQSIQRIDNSISLIANKKTMVRIYVDPESAPSSIPVVAEIAWRRDGGEYYLAVPGAVRLDPNNPLDINQQRRDLALSFNVSLPESALAEGELRVRLSRLRLAGGEDFDLGGVTDVTVSFSTAPPLRVRAIGLRYRIGSRTVTPEARHFDYFRSYLGRAYPSAELIWSQIVVDADFQAPFNASTSLLANAQLSALRSREVSQGIDPRTHYVGLVDDDNGRNFMRGRASDIPGVPAPDTVCSSPAGRPGGFAGDNDESYADWYAAHELGHTFGRYHPGFPVGSQDSSDPLFPYKNGLISDDNDLCMGLDLGDQLLLLPQRTLDGVTHHDIMTYAENQWVSDYTFTAIFERLKTEDALLG